MKPSNEQIETELVQKMEADLKKEWPGGVVSWGLVQLQPDGTQKQLSHDDARIEMGKALRIKKQSDPDEWWK
jgi:hypothetical protein